MTAPLHPLHRLNPAFQTPVRFSLMAALGSATEADFVTLRELLDVGDSQLSKAIAHLEGEGYLRVTKGYVANRPRTWVAVSKAGTKAFADHVAALREIAAGA
ncbi:MAG: transcriptional regulator [Leucobacter sp.]